MKIFLAADHGGFELKETLKTYLIKKGHAVVDCGNSIQDPKDDYPDFILPGARSVVKTKNSRGIFICRSGVGASIVANRVRGVLAVLTNDPSIVKMSRVHEDVNALCLASDSLTTNKAKNLVDVFLRTPFTKEARHVRRLKKVARIK